VRPERDLSVLETCWQVQSVTHDITKHQPTGKAVTLPEHRHIIKTVAA
jgi:hypothetical protein